jgi:hypothetical protein
MASIARTSEEHEGTPTSAVDLATCGSGYVAVPLVREDPSGSTDNSAVSAAS